MTSRRRKMKPIIRRRKWTGIGDLISAGVCPDCAAAVEKSHRKGGQIVIEPCSGSCYEAFQQWMGGGVSNLEALLRATGYKEDIGRIYAAAANVMAHLDGTPECAHYTGDQIRDWIEKLSPKGVRKLQEIAESVGPGEPMEEGHA
jgi:hypothetical protein